MENKNEVLFEAMLKAAAADALYQEMNEMPSCEELDKLYFLTLDMDKRIKRIISRDKKIKKVKKASVFIGKAAAAFLVLFTVSGAILFSVKASRNYILNTLIDWNSDHSLFHFAEKENNNMDTKYSFDYIPSGFYLESTDFDNLIKIFTYRDKNGVQIVIHECLAESVDSYIDNERINMEFIKINNYEAYLLRAINKGENNILLVKDNQIVFMITSTIEPRELILIAQNIKKF